jgi:hypothetical protein
MSEIEAVIRQIMDLSSRVEDGLRRLNDTIRLGVISEVEGGRASVEIGTDQDGAPVRTAKLRWPSKAGHKGQGVRRSSPLEVGEAVAVISPGGEMGEHSRIMPWGGTDESAAASENASDGEVTAVGNARFSVRDGAITFSVGGVTVTLTAAGLSQTGGAITHDGVAIDKTHVHKDVRPGDGLTGVPN